jgi:hypothetical protein
MNMMVADKSDNRARIVTSMAPAIAAAIVDASSIWYVMPFSVSSLVASSVILRFLLCAKSTHHTANAQNKGVT